MIKGSELSRLLNFTDAVVAVAITLLIVPLTDIFNNFRHVDVNKVITSYFFYESLLGLLISFFVVYSFWKVHRQIFSNVQVIPKSVETINSFWLLTVIIIPATTLINFSSKSNLGIYIYILVLIFNSVLLHIMKMKLYPGYKLYNNAFLIAALLAVTLITLFPNFGSNVYFLLLAGILLKNFFPKFFYD